MTPAPLRALGFAAIWMVAVLASGCASLPFFGKDDKAGAEPKPQPLAALYEVEVVAPGVLKKLLEDHLDLSRFRQAPVGDTIAPNELDRLAAAAPAQARALLETEGYFNAEVKVDRALEAGGPLPRVRVVVTPGPRVVIDKVDIESDATLAARSQGRDPPDTDRLETLRGNWPLRAGFPFRQESWTAAKVTALNGLRIDGYPAATWKDTRARIDAVDNTAALSLVVDPGPLFKLGPVKVEGLDRYDAESVLRLATFDRGDVYSEQVLLDWQERLLKVGLFEGASTEIDPDPATADAAPVTVRVKELTQKQATFGIGFSANTGGRVSVEYVDRKLFGQRLISRSKVEYGSDQKTLGSELTTWPLEGGWRHLVSANLESLRSVDEVRNSWTLRVGRARETKDIDRLYSIDATHSRIATDPYTTDATAFLGNFNWLRRNLDSVLTPTEGLTINAQLGAGVGRGTLTVPGLADQREQGPFGRAYTRLYWYRPIGKWFGTVRFEAGEVFTKSAISIPDTLLFRAGGDESVRGYAYRSLGPSINGAVASGRVLATGTVEMAHTFTDKIPALLGAVFVDAGNAADGWGDYSPVLGYGVGVRYRSPVGPIKLDLAYGQQVKQFRVHFSVGVTF